MKPAPAARRCQDAGITQPTDRPILSRSLYTEEAFLWNFYLGILRLDIHFEHGQHIASGEHTMVGKRADRARDRRSVYDFLPAAPKRDNVINIVNVVGRVGTQHRSRRFCLSAPTATKSRFYLEGQIESSATSFTPLFPV